MVRRSRITIRVVALLFYSAILLEAGSFAALCFLYGEFVGYADIPAADFSGVIPAVGEWQTGRQQRQAHAKDLIVHPYLGFIHDRDRVLSGADGKFLNYGFGGDAPSVQRRRDDRVLIAVTGGSLASNFVRNGSGLVGIEDILQRDPRFSGRKVVLLPLCWGEYKQPQQLIGLSYVFTLGAEFDFVVNIDGFNEIHVPGQHNVSHGVAAVYPKRWNLRVHEYLLDPALHARVGASYFLIEERERQAARFSSGALHYSFAAKLLWTAWDRNLEADLAERLQAIEAHESDAREFVLTGPLSAYTGTVELLEKSVAIWARASAMMHGITRANGSTYLHFLQPNQYVPGSKPMGAEERVTAFKPESNYARWVAAGYPLLRKAAAALTAEGVPFFDLTPMFREVTEPVYRDACCHLNQRGHFLLGQEIGRFLIDQPH